MTTQSEPTPRHSPTRTLVLCMTGTLLLATVVRFAQLDRHEFWLDETLSWYVAHHFAHWPPDGPPFWREVTSVPYFALLHLWSRAFGESPAALRSLSALCSLLTIPLIALAAARCAGRRTAFVAVLLAALSPLAVFHAHQVRVYAFWMLLAAAAGWLLYEAARTARRGIWAAYALVLLLMLFTHYFSLFCLPATLACLLVAPDRRRAARQWLTTHAAVAILFAPFFFAVILPLASSGSGTWIAARTALDSPLPAPLRSLMAFTPTGDPPPLLLMWTDALNNLTRTGWSAAVPLARWLGGLAITAALLGALLRPRRAQDTPPSSVTSSLRHYVTSSSFRNPSRRAGTIRNSSVIPPPTSATAPETRHAERSEASRIAHAPSTPPSDRPSVFRIPHSAFRISYWAILALAPLLAAWLYSLLVRPNYVVGRYDVLAWPAWIVFVSLLLERAAQMWFPRRAERAIAVAAAALVIPAALFVFGMARDPGDPSIRAQVQRWREHVGPADTLLLTEDLWPFIRELHLSDHRGPIRTFPAHRARRLGWFDLDAELADEPALTADADATAAWADELIRRETPLWLIIPQYDEHDLRAMHIHRYLYRALARARIEIAVIDNEAGLARLRRLFAAP